MIPISFERKSHAQSIAASNLINRNGPVYKANKTATNQRPEAISGPSLEGRQMQAGRQEGQTNIEHHYGKRPLEAKDD